MIIYSYITYTRVRPTLLLIIFTLLETHYFRFYTLDTQNTFDIDINQLNNAICALMLMHTHSQTE